MCVSKQAHKAHWSRNHASIELQQPIKKTVENSNTQTSSSAPLFFCHYCERGFLRKDNLVSHMQTHGFSKKKFECKVCKKSFAYSSNLKVHSLMHETKRSETAAKNEVRYTLILRFYNFAIDLFLCPFTITDLTICKSKKETMCRESPCEKDGSLSY